MTWVTKQPDVLRIGMKVVPKEDENVTIHGAAAVWGWGRGGGPGEVVTIGDDGIEVRLLSSSVPSGWMHSSRAEGIVCRVGVRWSDVQKLEQRVWQ